MKFLVKWIIGTVAIVITTYLLSGIHVDSVQTALITALVLGIINAVLRPILFVLTLPITIISLGLFAVILNALLVMLAALIVPGFQVDNFWWALLFSIVLAIINHFLNKIVE